MGLFNSLKSFFGLSGNQDYQDNPYGNERFSDFHQNTNERLPRYYQDVPVEEEEQMGVNIYSNPLEIAKFFEQQIDVMMRSMRPFGESRFFEDFFSNSDPFKGPSFSSLTPSEGEDETTEPKSGNLRDLYLKPGYQKQSLHENKSDSDLDGRVDLNDVTKIFQGSDSKVLPYKEKPKFHFYGQSVTSKTVRRPDGTVEIHRTVKDQEGNEETTVTHKRGDKEYSVTTRIDKDGRKEVIENLVNMEESEKDSFLKPQDSIKGPKLIEDWPRDWPSFERFFR